ncbi:family 10 glycosylhydrolase [Brasilonema sp. CT11]|nr:family 10 glycosylhydrolase [Brasilonema sp. CT11]
MNIKATILSGLFLLAATSPVQSQQPQPQLKQLNQTTPTRNITPPLPTREFRGVWVATVANIDFPSQPGLSTDQQKAELIAILDRAVQLKLNAIVFQIRPMADALYASSYEPWSEFLTGKMGQPPQPFYDPLEFAITEARKRGLELHVWFNPYRASHIQSKSPVSPNHITKTRPDLVRKYGKYMWLDPGEKEVQDYSLKVMMDVVNRYDVDGITIDDYFYPYPVRNEKKQNIEFPDEVSYSKYLRSGGKLNRNDWRRENINVFVKRLYQSVKTAKPWVKVGISPFGVWKPGYPQQISNTGGFNAYEQIYADSRRWLTEGWLDYFSPQLYWKIEQTAQSYPVLLNWWKSQNLKNRHLWASVYTSRVGNKEDQNWNPDEIVYQIKSTRGILGASGNIHFSMKPLMQDGSGISDLLLQKSYVNPALVPASPWLNNILPSKPILDIQKNTFTNINQLTWKPTGTQPVSLWVLQTKTGNEWKTNILPANQNTFPLTDINVDTVAVSGVSRYGIQSSANIIQINSFIPPTPP